MRDEDFIYHRRRAAEELAAAESASELAAARAHKEISEHYAAKAARQGEADCGEPIKANDAESFAPTPAEFGLSVA